MHISLFNHTLDRVPQARDVTWETFCTEIIGKDVAVTDLDKKQIPLFSPVEYKPGTTRKNKNVIAVHALALDFDKLTAEQVGLVQSTIDAEKWETVVYSSYSHGDRFAADGSCSFRVVIPLSEPVPAARWREFWLGFVAKHKLPCDPSRKDPAGMYALPYARNAENSFIERTTGSPLIVNSTAPMDVPQKHNAETSPLVTTVTHKELRQVATKLAKRSGDKTKLETALLRKVADGEAYQTPKGGRHETMLVITTALAREFPTASIDSLADLLDASHTAMQLEDPTFLPEQRHLDTVRALEGARSHRDEYISELKAKDAAELATRISKARGDGIDRAYNDEELDKICQMNGITRAELPKRWIMRKGDTCYVLTLQGYRKPVQKGEIVGVARDYLAPAGIVVTKITRDGMRYKTPSELLDDCSTSFDESITILGTDYGHTTQVGPYITMCEPACGLADIGPEYSARAEAYARVVGAAHLDKFLDWLATYSDLSRATCALYLKGEKGVGKTAFSQMLAQMWRSGLTVTLTGARGDFNDALTRSPVVVLDEAWPDKFKAQDSGMFRDLVSSTRHELSRKFLASSTIIGAIRLILMANDDRLIKFTDMENTASQEAVAQRLLILEIPKQTEDMFLIDPTLYTHLVTDRGFAKYCLWLKENRVVKSGRFLVAGEMSSTLTGITLATDASAQVCEWVAGIVANPKLLNRFAPLVRFENGQMLVNASAYAGTFEQVLSSKAYKMPTQNQAARAIGALSEVYCERVVDGRRARFHRLKRELVAEGIDRAGLGNAQEFLETLDKLSIGGNNG